MYCEEPPLALFTRRRHQPPSPLFVSPRTPHHTIQTKTPLQLEHAAAFHAVISRDPGPFQPPVSDNLHFPRLSVASLACLLSTRRFFLSTFTVTLERKVVICPLCPLVSSSRRKTQVRHPPPIVCKHVALVTGCHWGRFVCFQGILSLSPSSIPSYTLH